MEGYCSGASRPYCTSFGVLTGPSAPLQRWFIVCGFRRTARASMQAVVRKTEGASPILDCPGCPGSPLGPMSAPAVAVRTDALVTVLLIVHRGSVPQPHLGLIVPRASCQVNAMPHHSHRAFDARHQRRRASTGIAVAAPMCTSRPSLTVPPMHRLGRRRQKPSVNVVCRRVPRRNAARYQGLHAVTNLYTCFLGIWIFKHVRSCPCCIMSPFPMVLHNLCHG